MILRLCFRSGRNFFDIKQIVCLLKYNHLQQFFVIKLLLSLHNVIKLHKIVHENTQNMNLPTTTLPVFLWRVLRETVWLGTTNYQILNTVAGFIHFTWKRYGPQLYVFSDNFSNLGVGSGMNYLLLSFPNAMTCPFLREHFLRGRQRLSCAPDIALVHERPRLRSGVQCPRLPSIAIKAFGSSFLFYLTIAI